MRTQCSTMTDGQTRCPRTAEMAVSTTRRGDDMRTTVHYDEVYAPAKADRLCRQHGLSLVRDLITTLVPEGTVAV